MNNYLSAFILSMIQQLYLEHTDGHTLSKRRKEQENCVGSEKIRVCTTYSTRKPST